MMQPIVIIISGAVWDKEFPGPRLISAFRVRPLMIMMIHGTSSGDK